MRREDNRPRRADSSDVAVRAGVSRSTVSKVLNGRETDRIPPDTRQRVLQAARELNYVRNNRAHALVTGRTQRIGVALNHPDGFRRQGDYHRAVLEGVFAGAVECNHNLLFHAAHHPDWRALYTDIVGGSADGVLLVGSHPDDELAPALIESGFPAVFLSHTPLARDSEERLRCHVVDCDNVEAGRLVAAHLIQLGHRHIAFAIEMSSPRITDWQHDRIHGIREFLDRSGSQCRLDILFAQGATETVRQALRLRPTALILTNDGISQEVLNGLQAQHIRVPQDMSVINFNSTENCRRATVPLTSVWQPLHEIGLCAMQRVVSILSGEIIEPEVTRFPVRLDVRQSTGPSPRLP
ncbi:MAG: LacI family DNA-binding transcriptional regulator [Capsulimonadales bacterium]|nr:LacI family DNA-binding transcriptional regulator [Capsulimonadales bacterium]